LQILGKAQKLLDVIKGFWVNFAFSSPLSSLGEELEVRVEKG